MKLFAFDLSRAQLVTQYESHGVAVHPVVQLTDEARVTCMYITPMGCVGMHPAVVPQLFCVVSGHGWVRVANSDPVPITAGFAAYWEAGEQHESGTDEGMTAIIMEGHNLNPGAFLTEIG